MSERRFSEEPQAYREAMHRGDWDQAIALLEARAATVAGGVLPPEEQLALATLRGLRGDVEEALRILSEIARSSDPEAAVRARVQTALLRLSERTDGQEEIEELLDEATRLAAEHRGLLGLVAHARSRLFWRKKAV